MYYEIDGDANLSKAEASINEAIRLAPNSAKSHLYRAAVYGRMGKSDEAALELEEAVRINPSSNTADQAKEILQIMRNDPDFLKKQKLTLNFSF
jgi:Tfp pilus assembly protein PilF